jgi:periplasmic protein TonB
MSAERLHVSPTRLVSALAAIGLISLLVHGFLATNTVRTAPVQALALMAPPPPATPPPPENKKSEPDPAQAEPVRALDAREWTAGASAAESGSAANSGSGSGPATGDNTLGLAEAGTGGGDAFGLAGKPGGRELLFTGGGGGGNPNARFLQFASQVQLHLKQQLNQFEQLRQACYTVSVAVRVAASGSIESVRIRRSSGDRALDDAIRAAFAQLEPMDAVPPADMPWPLTLEVVSHGVSCDTDATHPPHASSQ